MENYNDENRRTHFDPMTGEPVMDDERVIDSSAEAGTENAASSETEDRYQEYRFSSEQNTGDAEKPLKEKKRKEKAVREKKSASLGKRFGIVIALALVFGLVGGTVFYGVNYIGNRFFAYNPGIEESAKASVKALPDKLTAPDVTQTPEPVETEAVSKPDMNVYTEDSGSTSTGSAGTVAEVAQNCMPSLVTIASVSVVEMQNFFGQTQQYEAQGAGSGVIVGVNDTELLIATNNHVVMGSKELSVGFIDQTSVEAFVKGTDPGNDLAVVGVKLENIPEETMSQIKIATIGNSDDLVLGEQVVAIGNALGLGQSVTSGYVSAMHRDMTFSDGNYTIDSTDLIQTDAPINSGNSGGGLFNMKGELVGINEAKSSMSSSGATVDGVGYAISIDKAEPILQDLMNLETRETVDEADAGYLGVTCADVTPDIAQMYNMPEGVCFTGVLQGGPAEEAGVQKGDVLVKFDGRVIDSYETLKDVLTYYPAGENVEIVVMRLVNGEYEETTMNIVLAKYDDIKDLQMNG